MQRTLNFLQDMGGHTLELFPQLEQPRSLRAWAGPCDLSPFALERFYEDRLVSELAAAAVSH
jgi:hypothetical protein